MTKHHANGAIYFTFDNFSRYGLTHGFFSRKGGVSTGIFESLSFSRNMGDSEEKLRENFRIAARALGFPADDIVLTKQTHTTNLRIARPGDRGMGYDRLCGYADIDGLVTDEKNIALAAVFADCVPLYFYDIKEKVIALSHSGWQGTAEGMADVTIGFMADNYNSKPENVICGIGPAINACCFEVDEDVHTLFRQKFDFAGHYITAGKPGKHNIDLIGINRHMLLEAGLLPENIEAARICTCCCDRELFFSHRRDGLNRGNMGAFLTLGS